MKWLAVVVIALTLVVPVSVSASPVYGTRPIAHYTYWNAHREDIGGQAAPPPLPGIWEVTATWDGGYAVARDTYQLPAELALGKLIPRGQDFTKRVRFIPGFGYNERLGG